MMESQARIRLHTGWQTSETERLFSAVREASKEGLPLRAVFERLSGDLGRKPNSIRNYYYACLRERPEAAPRSPAFLPFTPEETRQLLREVLMARGRGMSVRACVMQLAEGSHSRMLRYQNKYRTILKHRPELLAEVAEELRREGLPCPAPQEPPADQADPAFCDPEDESAARLMAQPCVHHLLEGLKELLRRAARAEDGPRFQRELDRQRVQHDLQRMAWAKDHDACAEALQCAADALRALLDPREAGAEALRADGLAALERAEACLGQHANVLH